MADTAEADVSWFTMRNYRFVEVGGDGVDASGTTGDWTVTGLTVQQSDTGFVTAASSGVWTLTAATLPDIGVFTVRTTGAWSIQGTTIESSQQEIHAVKTNALWTVSE
ncbi:MAG: hypothetical protein ABEH86_11565 [Haloarcula sp.]